MSPAAATRGDADAISDYVRARLADSAGAPEQAVPGYSALLAEQPDDAALALRAWRGAMAAGDMALAVRAAHLLDARGALPAEGRLLMMAEAVNAGDWRKARLAIDQIEDENAFEFLGPILRAWINLGAGEGATFELLQPRLTGLTAAYAGEQRGLLMLARGHEEGAEVFRAIADTRSSMARDAARIAAASLLIGMKRKDAALDVLAGDETLDAARALASKRKLVGGANTVRTGTALVMLRLAEDIQRQQPTPLALSIVRIAGRLDPANDAVHLSAASLLAGSGRTASALAALDRVSPKGAWAGRAKDARIDLLALRGERSAALTLATGATKAKGARAQDWVRLGNIQSGAEDHAAAAASYDRAIAMAQADGEQADWTFWLLKGGALEQAGQWPQAREALAKAVALAPEQPAVLNYLGYSQLERGENLDEAEHLIRRASELRPQDAAITDSLGWAYYLRGNLPKAIETLERAVENQPDEPTINEHLGDAYWAAGRRIDARYAWRAALLTAGDDAAGERLRGKIDTGPAAR